MKHASLLIVSGLILAVLGVSTYIGITRDGSSELNPADTSQRIDNNQAAVEKPFQAGTVEQSPTTGTTTPQVIQLGGVYQPFTPERLSSAVSTRRVLFFYANWCPTCSQADRELKEQQAKLPSDVTVLRVNYNDTDTDQAEKELARKYGITYQHTFVQLDSVGGQVTKWNGGQIEELLNNLQ